MRRRDFIKVVAGSAMTWPLTAQAQQPERMRRIGVLIALAETDTEGKTWVAGFRQGLGQRGWSEDHNLHIDYRFAPAGAQAQVLAKELVALHPEANLRNTDAGCSRAATGDPRRYQSYSLLSPTRSARASLPACRDRAVTSRA